MDEKELTVKEEVEEVDDNDEVEIIEENESTNVQHSFAKSLIARDVFAFSVRDIAEMGILCALAIILDVFVKIQIGASEGGSINIAMLPLFVIALRQGWFKGFLSGAIVFGLTTCLIDGYGIITYPLDYFVAYGSVGILGVLKPAITDKDYNVTWHSYVFSAVGILAAYVVRFIAATFDGMLVYETGFIDSVVYNAGYIFPSFIVTCVLFLALLINILKAFRNHNTKSL